MQNIISLWAGHTYSAVHTIWMNDACSTNAGNNTNLSDTHISYNNKTKQQAGEHMGKTIVRKSALLSTTVKWAGIVFFKQNKKLSLE